MSDADTSTNDDTEREGDGQTIAVDPRLLEILVCPVTGGPLIYDPEAGELVSKKAKLAYPIREGVPIMLADEARELDADGQ